MCHPGYADAALDSDYTAKREDEITVLTHASVREVIRAVEEVTGQKVPLIAGPRREGDPPVLVADSNKLQSALGWKPAYTKLAANERLVSAAQECGDEEGGWREIIGQRCFWTQ